MLLGDTVGNYYETVKVPERKTVTFGVDLAKLEEWLAGQEKLTSSDTGAR